MVNNIIKVVNIQEINEYTTIRTVEDNQIKLAQKNLRMLNENTLLPEKMLKSAIESWSKNGHILNSISRTINDYCVSSSINVIGEYMEKYCNEIKFVNLIMNYDDFYSAIILKEDINVIWLVIDDASFENNKKYLKSARVFRRDNNCEFNITIFDKEQIQDMNEQLESYESYKVIKK